MNSLLPALLSGVLFFVCSPNIIARFPKNGSKYLVTFVHSIIFAVLFYFFMQQLFLREGLGPGEIIMIVGIIFGLLAMFGLIGSAGQ